MKPGRRSARRADDEAGTRAVGSMVNISPSGMPMPVVAVTGQEHADLALLALRQRRIRRRAGSFYPRVRLTDVGWVVTTRRWLERRRWFRKQWRRESMRGCRAMTCAAFHAAGARPVPIVPAGISCSSARRPGRSRAWRLDQRAERPDVHDADEQTRTKHGLSRQPAIPGPRAPRRRSEACHSWPPCAGAGIEAQHAYAPSAAGDANGHLRATRRARRTRCRGERCPWANRR